MNKQTANLLYLGLIFIVIGFMVWLGIYVVVNKQAFFENPFLYGASKMKDVECSCFKITPTGTARFWFNDSVINFSTQKAFTFNYFELNTS